jgi:hypothetical protein
MSQDLLDKPKPASTRSGSETRQMQYRTTLRWNAQDYARLQADADRAGMTVGTYIRSCVLEAPAPGERRRASVNLQALTKALALVNRMGSSLHQIARFMNFNRILYPDEVIRALRGFDEMVFALMDAIRRER